MKLISFILLFTIFIQQPQEITKEKWLVEKRKEYSVLYTKDDQENIKSYDLLFLNGIKTVENFFNSNYSHPFNIFIYPDRNSLDTTWQKEWNLPDFKSECWMVASGIAAKLDILSPKMWDKQACEHVYSEKIKTQQLITHELIHVYHGQKNISPDFSNTEGIDWFVEGLATFASGQCDSLRISEIKKALRDNNIPETVDKFWSGKLKYGLSGSMVMYIDYRYGREKLEALLPINNKKDLFATLKTSETELLYNWKNFILNQ